MQARVTHAQQPHLFRNLGAGRFEDVAGEAGRMLEHAVVGRGAAYGDYDNDGDLDVLVTVNNGPALLLRNDAARANNVLRVQTIGTVSNRDGIGARVDVSVAGEERWQIVKTGSSYASQSELPLTFGLGDAAVADAVRVIWPSGREDAIGTVVANRLVVIREGEGLIDTTPIMREGRP